MFPISVSFSSPTVISLSILTAIGAYVLFGPDQTDRKKRGSNFLFDQQTVLFLFHRIESS